ncbi:MAG: immunity 17 family protein [Ruminococcus sp.]|nr:immunity 17 family protein [Ruminococcus sp.]
MNAFGVIVLLLVGFYLFFGAYKDFDWFYSGLKMQRAVRQMGRKNARILYMVSGIVLMIAAMVMVFV